MANRSQFIMRIAQRRVRHFSGTIKIQQVLEIESGQTKISEIVKEYEAASIPIYRWIKKFGSMKKKPQRFTVELDGDNGKLLALKNKKNRP